MDLGGLMRYFANSCSLVLCEDNDEILIYVSGQIEMKKCIILGDQVIKMSGLFSSIFIINWYLLLCHDCENFMNYALEMFF